MLPLKQNEWINAHEQLFWLEGNVRVVPAHHRYDAAPYYLYRVHWASFAGKNFTDRQRIKRKAQRWGKNYCAMPKAERLAVLAAMMEVEAQERQ